MNVLVAMTPLARRPGMVAVIVLTLSLGVGANAGVFSVFYQLLMQPVAVDNPEQLQLLSALGPRPGSISHDSSGPADQVFSFPLAEELLQNQSGKIRLAAYRSFSATLDYQGSPEPAAGKLISNQYFDALRLRQALGRLLHAQHFTNDQPLPVVVLSHDYWQRRFAGEESVLGQTIQVNGTSLEIIGVTPSGFRGLNLALQPDFYVPLGMVETLVPHSNWDLSSRTSHWLYLFGRLDQGSSLGVAQSALGTHYRNIIREREIPALPTVAPEVRQQMSAMELRLLPGAQGQSMARDNARTPLLLLMVVTTLVLLVACVNIANLLLAFIANQRQEIAVHSALGATAGRIFQRVGLQLLVLGLSGFLISLPLAWLALQLVLAMLPDSASLGLTTSLHWPVIVAAMLVSLAAMAIAGFVPLIDALRISPMEAIREQSAQSGGSRHASRIRAVLVVSQIAFALGLLCLGGLFIQSLANIHRVDPGFEIEQIMTFSISPAQHGYSAQRSVDLVRSIEEHLTALPGISSASASSLALLSHSNWHSDAGLRGPGVPPDRRQIVNYNVVGEHFFETLSIPLRSGRLLTAGDHSGRSAVAVVNQAFVDSFGLDEDVIGMHLDIASDANERHEIIGIVGNSRYADIKQAPPPQYFIPIYQQTSIGHVSFYLRSSLPRAQLTQSVRGVINGLDPILRIERLSSMQDVLRANIEVDTTIGRLSMMFAVLASILASVGLYGVIRYMVICRHAELGLRLALGATPTGLTAFVMRNVALLGLTGVLLGLAFAVTIGFAAHSLFYEIGFFSISGPVLAVLLMSVVIAAAGFLPARQAANIDPIHTLRS